ncbi:MAG: LPD5 domain-containing protein, partial [Verrucomicrobiota bacterium]
MDDTSPFSDKDPSQVATGADSAAVDPNPSPQSGRIAATLGRPVWEQFVTNSVARENNQGIVQAEQSYQTRTGMDNRQAEYDSRQAERIAARNSKEIWKGSHGKLLHKIGDTSEFLDPSDYVDHPVAGTEARKSLWQRDVKDAKTVAQGYADQLADPALNAKKMKQSDYDNAFAEGSTLQETDPRHIELKKQIMDHNDYVAQEKDLKQKHWDASTHAHALEATDPDEWHAAKKVADINANRGSIIQGAQDQHAEADTAAASLAQDQAALQARMAQGVKASELPAIQAQQEQHAQAQAVIDASKQTANAQLDTVKQAASSATVQSPASEGMMGTLTRNLATNMPGAFGTALGAVGGTALGGLAGIESGPVAIATGIAGGIAGGVGVHKLQTMLSKPDELATNAAQMEANAKEHPYVTQAANMASMLVGFMGGGGASVENVGGKVIGKALTKSGADVLRAGANGEVASTMASLIEKTTHGAAGFARVEGSTAAQEKYVDGKKDVSVLDRMAKGTIEGGSMGVVGGALFKPTAEALGAIGLFDTVKKVLWDSSKTVIPDVAAMQLSGDLYDHIVHGKEFNFNETVKRAGADVLPFVIQNLFMHGMGSLKSKMAGAGDGGENILKSVNDHLAATDPTLAPATADELQQAHQMFGGHADPAVAAKRYADGVLIHRQLTDIDAQDTQAVADAQSNLDAVRASGVDDKNAIPAAEAALETAKAGGGRADLVRASMKIASGQDMTNLTDAELTQLGVKRGKGDNFPTPLSSKELSANGLDSPLVREGADGSPILKDDAIKRVAAISPDARAKISMDETQADAAARSRAESEKQLSTSAPDGSQGEPAPGVGLPHETEAGVGKPIVPEVQATADPAKAPAKAEAAHPQHAATVKRALAHIAKIVSGKGRLGKAIEVSNDPKDRAVQNSGKITINPERLTKEALDNGMTPDQAHDHFKAVVDEEINHLAEHHAKVAIFNAAKGKGDPRSFKEWNNSHSKKLLDSDFAGAKGEKMRSVYTMTTDSQRSEWDAKTPAEKEEFKKEWAAKTDPERSSATSKELVSAQLANWDSMNDSQKLSESVRILMQERGKMGATERAKVVISEELKKYIQLVLHSLRTLAVGDGLTPEMAAYMKTMEEAIKDITTHDSARPTEPPAPKKDGNPPTPKAGPKPPPSEGAGPPAGAGQEAGGLKVGDRVAFNHPGAGGDAEGELVKLSPDGSNAIVSRNGVNFPVKTDSIRALDAPKDPVSETQAPKASTDETQTHRHQKPYSEMVKGDRFTDNGQEFQVWRNRQGTVEAHPIIDGKPIINNQSGVRFAVTEMAKLRNPDDRYLDDSKLSQTTPLADTPQTPTPQTNGRKEKASTQARKKGQVLNEPAAGDNTSPVADTALSEGDKKMLDALDGLFTSELPKNPAEDFEQKIPPDRFEKLMGAAASWVKEGVDSPEKLAAKLGSVADGKLKPFSQRIWSALHAAGADGDTQPDWVKMHAADIPIAAKAPRKGRNFNPSRTMELFHSNPFVDSILRQGGMMSASRARKEMGKAWWKLNSSQYEDAPRFNNPTFNSIYSRNGQLTPNRVAEGISGHGLMETGDVNRMWAELRKAADSTTNQNRTIGKEMVKSALAEKQTVEFSKVNQERESGVMGLQAGDFNPGEGHEFTIGGERFTVEANDGETVTIKDGEKFGEQRIPVDETLWVEISGADSFLPEEDVISGSGKLVDETIKQGYGSLDERDQSTPEDPGLGLVPKTESDRQGEGSAGVPQGGSPAQGDSGEVKRPPVSKMDIKNQDNKELFADDGGFKLGQDSTVDGDKVAADLKAKEEAKAAQDAAQGDMFGEPPPPAPGTPEFKVLTAAEKQAAVKHLVARKQAGKITDFGEKLQGAKKDLWSGYRKSLSEELPSEASEITLSKHLPEPDYDKAIAEGVDPDSLATFKALRDLIPSKPRKGYKLERWVSSVKELRPLMKMLMDGNESGFKEALSKITDGNQSMKDQISLYKDLGHPAFTKAADWKILNGVTSFFKDGVKLDKPMSTQNALYKGRFISGMEATPDRAGYQELLGKIRKRILNELETPAEKNAKPVEFSLYRDRFTKELYVGKKAVNGVIRMKGGFADVKDARQYMTDNQAKLEEQWAGMKVKPDYRRQVNSPRQGPTRREGDATPESFQDAFGFRGVQFGNWVEDSRRQVDINEAFDAFMDLADAIGIPPKAVSLDGSLGMAFGARGNAGAAAHYEPGQVVINLTKKSGPGSLGHEWFHAFDNYFARLDKTGETKAKSLDSFATTNSGSPKHMRPEVWAAFKQIRAVLDKGPFAERSKTLDDAKSKSYYGTTIEKAARAFERYTVDRLAKKDVSNDYLVNIVKDFSPALPTPEEMSGGITQAFDHLFNTLDTKETDKGVALHTSELPKRKEKDPFYSKLERTVDEKIPNNASPAQVIATLTSSGVKAEEIKWSG